jgi:hydrogenase nickel incorporation protein HypB
VRVQAGTDDLDCGARTPREIRLEQDVLGANKLIAARNRAHFASHGIRALNLVSSPGSGKTTLLCATIEALKLRAPQLPLAVIEGDQQTSRDADRIRATGAPAIQVNTGKGCHLDARMVGEAFARLPLHVGAHADADAHTHAHAHEYAHEHTHEHAQEHAHGHSGERSHAHAHEHAHGQSHDTASTVSALLFIENVGNLVCPAMWDLGEAAKVVILSVTEGDDKPLKYPDMFAAAQHLVLNKIDLLPHVDFDVPRCIEFARRVNPAIGVLSVSARNGQGLDAWLDWLLQAA